MNVITGVSDKFFSLNGVRYVRNYLSKPYGQNIEVYNCYDRKDILVGRTNFSDFSVNGVTHTSAQALQAALLEVIYNRNFGAAGSSAPIVKPVKTILSSTTGFSGNIYTLQADDDTKWLLFNLATAFTIKVPTGVFAANAEFEGLTAGTGQATFVTDAGISLLYGPSDLNKSAERYSVFGLKFTAINQVLLFGKLALA